MIQKGTMRGFKKVLGILLLVMAGGFLFNIQQIQDLIMNYAIVSIGILIISGYFLLKSGAQLW